MFFGGIQRHNNKRCVSPEKFTNVTAFLVFLCYFATDVLNGSQNYKEVRRFFFILHDSRNM